MIGETRETFRENKFNFKRIVATGAALVASIGSLFVYNTCTTYVQPNEFGIRQVQVGLPFIGEKGTHTNIINSGIRREIPGVEKIYTFPKDIQVLTLKKKTEQADKTSRNVRYEP